MKTFKTWLKLKEDGTSTACVAVFARPLTTSPIRRTWPSLDKKKKSIETKK